MNIGGWGGGKIQNIGGGGGGKRGIKGTKLFAGLN